MNGHSAEKDAPVVLDLDDRYFDGQTLPDALSDYAHVHSATGVCVKNVHGPFCALPPGAPMPDAERDVYPDDPPGIDPDGNDLPRAADAGARVEALRRACDTSPAEWDDCGHHPEWSSKNECRHPDCVTSPVEGRDS